jgi:hypothetical protein
MRLYEITKNQEAHLRIIGLERQKLLKDYYYIYGELSLIIKPHKNIPKNSSNQRRNNINEELITAFVENTNLLKYQCEYETGCEDYVQEANKWLAIILQKAAEAGINL